MGILVVLNILSLVLLEVKFEFKLTTLVIVQSFAFFSLVFILLNLYDIFYFPGMDPTAESRMNLQIILFSGLLLPLLLSRIFNYSAFGDLTKQVTSITIATGLLLIGISVIEIFTQGTNLLNLSINNNEWIIDFTTEYFILLGIYLILSITGISMAIQNILSHDVFSQSKLPIFLFGGGFFLLFSALNIDETITTPLGISIYLLGLTLLFSGIIHVFYNIYQNPMTTIFLRNNTQGLFKKEVVKWVLFANRENGPTLELQSEGLKQSKEITPDEIFMFGVQSLMTAYNENKFIQNTSITPFAARNDYFALTVSFTCKDDTLKDHRFKQRLQTVLIIIIPTRIFFSFIKPVKNLSVINNMIRSKDLEGKDYADIKDPEFLENLGEYCLNAFI